MLKPLGDRVVVKCVKQKKQQRAELFYQVEVKEKPQIAEVIAVGPGGKVDGETVEMQVKKGDKVVLNNMQEQKYKIWGRRLHNS